MKAKPLRQTQRPRPKHTASTTAMSTPHLLSTQQHQHRDQEPGDDQSDAGGQARATGFAWAALLGGSVDGLHVILGPLPVPGSGVGQGVRVPVAPRPGTAAAGPWR